MKGHDLKKAYLVVWAFFFLVAGTSTGGDYPVGQVEIYFLKDQSVRANEIREVHINSLKLAEFPWISTSDISTYKWDSQEIYLKEESYHLLGQFPDRINGPDLPFVVVANGERIFVSSCLWFGSSQRGLDIGISLIEGDQKGLRFGAEESRRYGDPRKDDRLKMCLEEAGILAK